MNYTDHTMNCIYESNINNLGVNNLNINKLNISESNVNIKIVIETVPDITPEICTDIRNILSKRRLDARQNTFMTAYEYTIGNRNSSIYIPVVKKPARLEGDHTRPACTIIEIFGSIISCDGSHMQKFANTTNAIYNICNNMSQDGIVTLAEMTAIAISPDFVNERIACMPMDYFSSYVLQTQNLKYVNYFNYIKLSNPYLFYTNIYTENNIGDILYDIICRIFEFYPGNIEIQQSLAYIFSGRPITDAINERLIILSIFNETPKKYVVSRSYRSYIRTQRANQLLP